MLPVTTAQSSAGGAAIRYALHILPMM